MQDQLVTMIFLNVEDRDKFAFSLYDFFRRNGYDVPYIGPEYRKYLVGYECHKYKGENFDLAGYHQGFRFDVVEKETDFHIGLTIDFPHLSDLSMIGHLVDKRFPGVSEILALVTNEHLFRHDEVLDVFKELNLRLATEFNSPIIISTFFDYEFPDEMDNEKVLEMIDKTKGDPILLDRLMFLVVDPERYGGREKLIEYIRANYLDPSQLTLSLYRQNEKRILLVNEDTERERKEYYRSRKKLGEI